MDVHGHSDTVVGKCVMETMPALNSETYLDCVARLLTSPNTVVDDHPGWHKNEEFKLMTRHELLPDLRFLNSGSDSPLFAFFARKDNEVTVDQPPIRDLSLTLSSTDMPGSYHSICPHDYSCSDPQQCITPIVRDDYRHRCNWWRVPNSVGEGTTSETGHNMFIWVKRRFAIDPCHVSAELGGWKGQDEIREKYCSSATIETPTTTPN
jgi:hypothetical protein